MKLLPVTAALLFAATMSHATPPPFQGGQGGDATAIQGQAQGQIQGQAQGQSSYNSNTIDVSIQGDNI